MEDRIIELEIRVGYQQDLLDQLNTVVLEFSRRVEHLEDKLEEYRKMATDQEPAVGPANDPPPHY